MTSVVDTESMGAADAVGDEGHASAGDLEVLAWVRRARERGAELDERSLRTALRLLGIDPGPLWDRPLHAQPRRLPIRPAALTRLEGLLAIAENAATENPATENAAIEKAVAKAPPDRTDPAP